MWGGVGNPRIRPKPIQPIRDKLTGKMLNVKEWLSSMKSSKIDKTIPQYMTPGGPEPLHVVRLPDSPELMVSPENIRPGFKWLAKKHPTRKRMETVYLQVHTGSRFAPMIRDELNRLEHEIREEKIQSDELLAREKIIQANLEKALGDSSLFGKKKKPQEEKKVEYKNPHGVDVTNVTGTFVKTKAALRQMAKVERKEARRAKKRIEDRREMLGLLQYSM